MEIPMSLKELFLAHVAPHMSAEELQCLFDAVTRDDPALVQDCTTLPYRWETDVTSETPCQGADALAYALWKSRGLKTVIEVREAFDRFVPSLGPGLQEFLRAYDTARRPVMITQMSDALQEALHACTAPQIA